MTGFYFTGSFAHFDFPLFSGVALGSTCLLRKFALTFGAQRRADIIANSDCCKFRIALCTTLV